MRPIHLVLAAIGGALLTAFIMVAVMLLAYRAGQSDLYREVLAMRITVDSLQRSCEVRLR